MSRTYVCKAAALEDGSHETVTIDGTEVCVIRYDGEYYAIENRCKHQGGTLCGGLVRGALDSEWKEVGERATEFFTDRPAIACPSHGWEYDLATGRHLGDSDVGVETYEVEEHDGGVYLLSG